MNLSVRNKYFFVNKKAIGSAVFLVILLVFLNIFQSEIRNSFYVISSPITNVFNRMEDSMSFSLESILSGKETKKENQYLKEKNQELLSHNILLQESLRKSKVIEEFLGDNTINNKAVLGNIVGLDFNNDFIVLDRGSADGLSENMPVISEKKVLYGKLFKVYESFSHVMLISNQDSVVNVKVYPNQTSQSEISNSVFPPIFGVVRGKGKTSLDLDLVSSDDVINNEDILVTSALEGVFPKDLLVGKIIAKQDNDLKPFQTAQVQPFFDIRNRESLLVVTNYKKE